MNDIQLPDLPPEAIQAFNDASPQVQRFITLVHQGSDQAEAYRQAFNAQHWSDNAVRVQASRLRHRPNVDLIMGAASDVARQILTAHSVDTALGLVKTASLLHDPEGTQAAKLAVAERAASRVLQGAGLLGQGSQINVNVGIDQRAIELWQQGGASAWRDAAGVPGGS